MKAILEPQAQHSVPESLAGRVKSIQNMLEHPEKYLKDANEYSGLRDVVLGKVSEKIRELNALVTPKDKEDYVEADKRLESVTLKLQFMAIPQTPYSTDEEREHACRELESTLQRFKTAGVMNLGEMLLLQHQMNKLQNDKSNSLFLN